MTRSQTLRILDRLRAGSLCSMEPLDWSPRIYRTAARIKDLRDDGHDIITRTTCYLHYEPQHHALYELTRPDQGSLFE